MQSTASRAVTAILSQRAGVRALLALATAVGARHDPHVADRRGAQRAVAARQRGLPVLLLHTTDIAKRDYTDGEGQQLLDALVRMGAKTVTSVGGAMDIVKQL